MSHDAKILVLLMMAVIVYGIWAWRDVRLAATPPPTVNELNDYIRGVLDCPQHWTVIGGKATCVP